MFWRCGFSNILSNTTRGVLAEFLVFLARGTHKKPLLSLSSYDLEYKGKKAVFSEELMTRFNPRPNSVKAVALCIEYDSVLRPLLRKYKNIKVVVIK